jgi:lactonase
MDTSRLAGFAKVAANLTGGGADSNGVDSAGNVYQAELAAREFVMLDRYGKQIGSLQLPSLAAGDSVSNIVIKPGSRDGYITTGGADGAYLYRFRALAPGLVPYSHS